MKLLPIYCAVSAMLSSSLIAVDPVVPVQDIDRDLVTIHATGGAEREDGRLIAAVIVSTLDVSSGEGVLRNAMSRRELASKLQKIGITEVRHSGVAKLSVENGKHVTKSNVDVLLDDDSQLVKLKGIIDLWPGITFGGLRNDVALSATQQMRASLDAMATLQTKATAYEKVLGRKLKLVSFQEEPATLQASGRLCVEVRGRFELTDQ